LERCPRLVNEIVEVAAVVALWMTIIVRVWHPRRKRDE